MKQQRGSTLVGFILGLLVGLGLALAVAVYVTKVPILFFNKAASRNADQDANEFEKNKDWDPNAPLYGKNPAKPVVPALATSAPVSTNTENKPAVTADPLGDLVKAHTPGSAAPVAASNTDAFTYFVQVGAYRTPEDAEAQRAKLSLGGIETRISEREQTGRKVYRVRVGPFEKREEADTTITKLKAAGVDTALVRVQR
ncbi:SPOR domain-containing protein [Rhodoferax sp.]|uniref:SPOR domain-containing protein n=1 Tax=Rhodoferax sp. TaxID=50421 RepID=UPI0008AF011A|nr:SPOR domain-containing protein [Rhodoferax sp.]MDO8318008.1 SPOR domain-containing protein [Rhodoferax sp.]OGB52022.1 MAG: sporulation protein [Burkholderiales bacterium RIFOXYD12_FULL_59_19]OGB76861.1 MAG: sporulation protein [Burkholderiales bacterium RIFOXYC12_FULL_60_6]